MSAEYQENPTKRFYVVVVVVGGDGDGEIL
jgi:hypothetical protein